MLGSDDLLVILALVREGTLERAAAWLERDPSSVYHAINRVEDRIGATLFERSRKGFHPSGDARKLAEIGRTISDGLSTAEALASHWEAARTIRLVVTTTDLLLEHCLLPDLPTFRSQFPGVQLEFTTTNSFENMWERGVDIAIRPSNAPPDHLLGKPVIDFAYRLVCAPDYAAKSDVGAHPSFGGDWLVPSGPLSQHPVRKWFDNNIKEPQSITGFDSYSALVRAARAGHGLAIVPDLPALRGDFQTIACAHLPAPSEIWCLYHQSKRDNAIISAFAAFAQTTLRTTN